MAWSTARGVIALALIAPVVAMVVTIPIWGVRVYVLVVPIAFASALIVGGPAVSVGLRRGWSKLHTWLILGAVSGALPVFILGAVVSILQGRAVRMDRVVYTRLQPLAIVIGSVSAMTFWLTQVQSKYSRVAVVGLQCAVILIVLVVVCGLLWLDGWVPTFHGAHRRWT